MNTDNLPVNDRTVQALAAQLEQIQQGVNALAAADAWGETAAFGRKHQNRCLLTHHPRWFLQAVLAGDRLSSQPDVDCFNAVMKEIDAVADDDSSSPFSEVLPRELKFIRIEDVTFTQGSYAADWLGQDRTWRDSMYKTHRDRARLT